MEDVKLTIVSVFGVVGGFITSLLGGWDVALQTLIIFMAVDYVTGLIVAGVFHESKKTDTGKLQSNVGAKGIFKKGMIPNCV
jgi:phage-related holin